MKTKVDWKTINLPYGPIFDNKLNEEDSFSKRKLDKPGILIQIETGEEFLIGDINKNRGICDDCAEFDNTMLVVKYAIVFKRKRK
jgi:hypothetical protein